MDIKQIGPLRKIVSAWTCAMSGAICLLVYFGSTPSPGVIMMQSPRVARKNVLLIMSDDLRPELGAYSRIFGAGSANPDMLTPYLDGLAARSLVLGRAYVQQAICSVSRTSMLTARRPETTRVYTLSDYWREVGGNFTTLPEYFKEHGYLVTGIGKIYHGGHSAGQNDPMSWTTPQVRITNIGRARLRLQSWKAVSPAEQLSEPLQDDKVTEHALNALAEAAPKALTGELPFFLAVGYFKPHLPFRCPKKFFDYYPKANIRLPNNPHAPVAMPEIAWSSYNELRSYEDIEKLHASGMINSTLPDSVTRDLRRAYYACVSYVDEQVGVILKQLDKLGLRENTIIAFAGDHGYQLGEHGEWAKQTNFELATRTPMMVSIPGVTDHGIPNNELAEFVDLFPTLVEAAGLPQIPVCPPKSSEINVCREGSSLMSLLRGASGQNGRWKTRVFTQYNRGDHVMGYSMRTDRYRYTEWTGFTGLPECRPVWEKVFGVELYDLFDDAGENVNRADDPALGDLRRELRELLHSGWRSALPSEL